MLQEVFFFFFFAYFPAFMRYDLVFWVSHSISNILFKLQKQVIQIIRCVRREMSCGKIFKDLNILPLTCMQIKNECPEEMCIDYGIKMLQ
jgi:hypothetical protein